MSWQRQARRAARRAGFSRPNVFVRQMGAEAHGDDLTSPAGAQGPAQIMPATARAWGLTPAQVHSRRASYTAAAEHMAGYERQYGTRGALVAYNAGPGRVGGPLPAETQNYVRTILGNHPGSTAAQARASRSSSPGRMSGFTPSTVKVGTKTVTDQAGFADAQRRSFLANYLQQQGKSDSVLFRSGLLSTAAPSLTDYQRTILTSSTSQGTTPHMIGGGSSDAGVTPTSGQLSKAVAQAQQRLGIHEAGWNRGRRVDKMESFYGMVGQPWCGIFTGRVLQSAGVKGVGSWIASVSEIERKARAGEGPFSGFVSPQHAHAGDLLITSRGQHVGFIESVGRNGMIHTIEGNTGTGEVARRTHAPGSVYGVARVRYQG